MVGQFYQWYYDRRRMEREFWNWALEQNRKFPDTIGYVWTAENDSNTLRVDAKIFASAKKYLRKKKFPDTCGHGLKSVKWKYLVRISSNTKTLHSFHKSIIWGCFMNFWVIFRYIWKEIIFLEGLVKLKEIRNVEDLVKF